MKKNFLSMLFALFLIFSFSGYNNVRAEDGISTNFNEMSSYIPPTKIWYSTHRCTVAPSTLPRTIYVTTNKDGYFYSGNLSFVGYGSCPISNGSAGYYEGYLYGGRATTFGIDEHVLYFE